MWREISGTQNHVQIKLKQQQPQQHKNNTRIHLKLKHEKEIRSIWKHCVGSD